MSVYFGTFKADNPTDLPPHADHYDCGSSWYLYMKLYQKVFREEIVYNGHGYRKGGEQERGDKK